MAQKSRVHAGAFCVGVGAFHAVAGAFSLGRRFTYLPRCASFHDVRSFFKSTIHVIYQDEPTRIVTINAREKANEEETGVGL